MNVVLGAVAALALGIALVSLRLALVARRELAALTAKHDERARQTAAELQQLAAHAEGVEQRASEGLDHVRADLVTRVDAGLAQIQDALTLEVAVQVASVREDESS